jgi:hypothetical protein
VTDTSFDDDGDGVVDRNRRDELTIVEPGTRRRVVRNINADGLLADSTTTTSNVNNVVTQLDQDGDGYTDQMQLVTFGRTYEKSMPCPLRRGSSNKRLTWISQFAKQSRSEWTVPTAGRWIAQE